MPIIINMNKARTIHMAAIRAARNIKLEALDVPYMRAIEVGDVEVQNMLANRKQTLRDIPQNTDLITGIDTPEKLINVWPEQLTIK